MQNPVNEIVDNELVEEILEFILERQDRFLDALKEFGEKMGIGYTEYWFTENGVEKKIGERGEFTGHNLCFLSTGAIIKAIKLKFGENINLYPVLLTMIDQDIFPHLDATDADLEKKLPKNVYMNQHWVLQVGEDENGYLVDATARQTDYQLDADQILVTPIRELEKSYNAVFHSSGFADVHLSNIEEGFSEKAFPGVTMEDFDILVSSLN